MDSEIKDNDRENLGTDYEPLPSSNQPHWRWSNKLRSQLSFKTEQRFKRHFIDKLPSLARVINFLGTWFILVTLLLSGLLIQIQALTPYYTAQIPALGGVYTEGLVGRATNFNPIYATTNVDKSVASLVFASPYRYNRDNKLEPVLAESIIVDDKAQQYTLTLKQGLTWHDGHPITVDDLIFTILTIQDPLAQSPLRSDWQDVNLDKIDDYSLTLTLEAGFSPFPANLTLGLIPEHLLKQVPKNQLRRAPFNYQPVGSGPFIFKELVSLAGGGADTQELRIELSQNPAWADRLPPSHPFVLDELHFLVMPSKQRLTEFFNRGHISGSFDLDKDAIKLRNDEYNIEHLKTVNAVYLFFKNSSPFCSSLTMRQALSSALDPVELLGSLDKNTHRIFGPLLPEHLGYGLKLRPPTYDLDRAERLLLRAGWQRQANGWYKDGQRLSLVLTTQKDTDYALLAQNVEHQLQRLDIDVKLDLRSAENISLEILQHHNYGDLLIYGLNLGGDSDVYSYWHSSQIDSTSTLRLNLSEYRSKQADEALEAGRSRADIAIRYRRYIDFQRVWAADLPALALYRPQLNYYTLNGVIGPPANSLLITPSDRFYDVTRWSVLRQRQYFNAGNR